MRSATPEHPTVKLLIRNMLTELLAYHQKGWVTFETKRAKCFAEVAQEGEDLIVFVSYPFSENYQTLFPRHGITIPEGWQIKKFSKKFWLLSGGMVLMTNLNDQDRVVDFIARLFPSLYGADPDYRLTAYFQ